MSIAGQIGLEHKVGLLQALKFCLNLVILLTQPFFKKKKNLFYQMWKISEECFGEYNYILFEYYSSDC